MERHKRTRNLTTVIIALIVLIHNAFKFCGEHESFMPIHKALFNMTFCFLFLGYH